MTNVTTLKKGGTAGSSGYGIPNYVKHEVDIAAAVTAGLATTEQITVTDIPADVDFQLLQVEVVEDLSLGAGARIDIGDNTDDDEFVTNATTLTAGTNLTLLKNDLTGGRVTAAADALKVKVTGATIATGKLRFVWLQGDTQRAAPTTVQ